MENKVKDAIKLLKEGKPCKIKTRGYADALEIEEELKKILTEEQLNRAEYYRLEAEGQMELLKRYLKNWQPEFKKKVGRPKLPPEKLKQKKMKRSEQMKQLLADNDIEITTDGFLVGYKQQWEFLPNGRVREGNNTPISVHQFLKDWY